MKYIPIFFLAIACAQAPTNKNTVALSSLTCSQDNRNSVLGAFRTQIMENPESAKNLYELGRCYYQMNDYARALYYFDQSLARKIDKQSLNAKANTLFQLERFEASLKVFEQSLKTDPGKQDRDHWVAKVNMAKTYYVIGDYDKAYSLWKELEILDNELVRYQVFEGNYLLSVQKSDYKKVEFYYDLLPNNLKTRFDFKFHFAYALVELGQIDRAIPLIIELKQDATPENIYFSRILALEKRVLPERSLAGNE